MGHHGGLVTSCSRGKGSCCSTDLSVQQGPLAGWSFVGWQEGVVSCRSTDLSTQRDTIVGPSLSIRQEGACRSTDLSVQRGPIAGWSFVVRWEGLLQH